MLANQEKNMVLGRLLTEKKWQTILDSIQPGGENWFAFKKSKSGGCLKSCPGYKKCRGYGPDDLCTTDWRCADVSPRVVEVLFHVFNNFDYYNQNDLPSYNKDSESVKQLRQFLFNKSKELEAGEQEAAEEDEVGLGVEDLRRLRSHKKIERNRNLAADAKRVHGWTCQACEFSFWEEYGEIGKKYIEAHHLVPLAELKGKVVVLDPKKHFCVLCANCHRMIHRSEHVGDVEAFRAKYLKNR